MTVIHNHLRIFRNYSHKVRVLPLKIFFLKKVTKFAEATIFLFCNFLSLVTKIWNLFAKVLITMRQLGAVR